MVKLEKKFNFLKAHFYSGLLMIIGVSVALLMQNTRAETVSEYDISDPVVATLIKGMKNREKRFNSIDAYWVKEVYNNVSGYDGFSKGAIPVQLSQLFWLATKDKVYEEENTLIPDYIGDKISSFDGTKTTVWMRGSDAATAYYGSDAKTYLSSQGTTEFQIPLAGMSDNSNVLTSDRIAKYDPYFVRMEVVKDVETYIIESAHDSASSEIHRWWIAPKYDYVVMKHEIVSKNISSADNKPQWRHMEIVDHIYKVGDIWVPDAKRYIMYAHPKHNETGQEVWLTLYRSTLTGITINADISDTLFDSPIPVGVKVSSENRPAIHKGGNISEFIKRAQENKPNPQVETQSVLGNIQN